MPSVSVNLPRWMHHYLKNIFGNKSKICRKAIKKFQNLLEMKLPEWMWDYDRDQEIATMTLSQDTIDYMDDQKDKRKFFSRSEFIRMAVFLFILKDLDGRKIIMEIEEINQLTEAMIRVPKGNPNENGNYEEFKTYKIIRRLEY